MATMVPGFSPAALSGAGDAWQTGVGTWLAGSRASVCHDCSCLAGSSTVGLDFDANSDISRFGRSGKGASYSQQGMHKCPLGPNSNWITLVPGGMAAARS